ncbi:MAG: ion transporter [Flavobacteriales bacterium]|nr:ion transporter [Flavobacteriales bacterium]MCB9363159.1 ion transporter [Flavobacteriales bacterium]
MREKLHTIIFEADTKAGKLFDVVLLWAILISIVVVMLESVVSISEAYNSEIKFIEWSFTILFTLEYIARIIAVKKPLKYIFSFYGVIDLLSILPSFIGIFVTGTHSLSVIRSIRLLRIFRIFKLARYVKAAQFLNQALIASKNKIIVFLFAVLSLVVVLGTLIYLIESPEAGFTSIPRSIYWAIVTLTTVGYGDITPQTVLGQTLASIIMIIGYAIIAVPTGIIGAEYAKTDINKISTQACPSCSKDGHDQNAVFCKYCGEKL